MEDLKLEIEEMEYDEELASQNEDVFENWIHWMVSEKMLKLMKARWNGNGIKSNENACTAE